MAWKGRYPIVKLVTQTYQTGVKLTHSVMTEVATHLQRLTNWLDSEATPLDLGKWFVDICCHRQRASG